MNRVERALPPVIADLLGIIPESECVLRAHLERIRKAHAFRAPECALIDWAEAQRFLEEHASAGDAPWKLECQRVWNARRGES
jgi:hypothetical protein